MDHSGLLAWRFVSVSFNLLFCVLAVSSRHPVCSFDTLYHPTDFTVLNEPFRLVCCICYTDTKKSHPPNTHYTCQAEASLPLPGCIFLRKSQKVVFFNASRTFNSDAKLGPHLGALWTHNSQVNLFTFLSEGFQWWNYILLFAFWIVLLFLYTTF